MACWARVWDGPQGSRPRRCAFCRPRAGGLEKSDALKAFGPGRCHKCGQKVAPPVLILVPARHKTTVAVGSGGGLWGSQQDVRAEPGSRPWGGRARGHRRFLLGRSQVPELVARGGRVGVADLARPRVLSVLSLFPDSHRSAKLHWKTPLVKGPRCRE